RGGSLQWHLCGHDGIARRQGRQGRWQQVDVEDGDDAADADDAEMRGGREWRCHHRHDAAWRVWRGGIFGYAAGLSQGHGMVRRVPGHRKAKKEMAKGKHFLTMKIS